MSIAAVPLFGGDEEISALPRFTQTKKETAEFSLTISCTLDGVFEKKERIFYFRVRHGSEGFSESAHSYADGEGTGYGFSASVDPRNTTVEVEVHTYWTSKTASGKTEIAFLVPYFTAKDGKDAGYTYSVRWKKLK